MKLRYKLAIFSILLTGIGILSISLFSERFISQATFEDLEQQSKTVLQNFLEKNKDIIQSKNEGVILRELYILFHKLDLVYGMVMDADGKIIAHTDINQVGQKREDYKDKINGMEKDFISTILPEQPNVLQVFGKVKSNIPGEQEDTESFFFEKSEDTDQVVGLVQIGISMNHMEKYLKSIRRGMLIISILCLVMTLFISFMFAYFITRPLGKLMSGIQQLRTGNMNVHVEIPSKDEIGEVGKAFNNMVANLATAETELLNTNKELNNKVEDLAKAKDDLESAQEKLVRTEKLAAVGQLASSVGHELRNPLAAINNAVYFLKNALSGSSLSREEPEIEQMLNITQQEINSSTNIIGDLLSFARIIKLQPQNTNINVMVESLIKSTEIPSRIKIIKELEADLPEISCDPLKIRQVFVNIFTNAIHSISGKGSITISTRVLQDNGTWVYISFKDTGEGVLKKNIHKIFEPLFTTKAKGTGLGLSICQGYVEKHGGKIIAESENGSGTLFTIKLPKVIKIES